jgi:CubicO group peptidase (beta-lactamase class C family)
MKNKIFVLLLSIALSNIAHAQGQPAHWNDTLTMIEKVLACYQPDKPGYEIAISRDGATIFSKASGMADLERQVRMTSQTITEAGSVSKQFTAAAILLLAQQGKLSLNDDVRKYIPELPDYGTPVRLRHMMHHTSGIRDWGNVAALTGWPRGTKAYNNDDALEILCRQKELNNKPGDEFIYSNSNYNLFAIIIQRVSGLSLADFTKKYIFEPAGMLHTTWRDNYKRLVPNRAIAYSKNSDGYLINMPNENAYGNGGVLTTAEDLLKWQQFYLSGKPGGPAFLARQITPDTLNNNLPNVYAAGLFIGKKRGWDVNLHDGATAGYRAYLETFPQLKLSIAFLSNTSEFDEEAIVAEIEKILVKNKAASKNEQTKFVPVPSSLQKLSGLYRNDRTGYPLAVSLRSDTLTTDYYGPLKAISNRHFEAQNAQLIFDERGLNYIAPYASIRYSRVDPATTDARSMKAFLGQFYAEELQATVTVLLRNEVLTLRLSPQQEYTLTPAYQDALVATTLGVTFLFERDADGRVTGMKASDERVRNLKFIKIKNNEEKQ